MNQSQDVSHNIRMSMEEENKMREEQFNKPLANESTDVIQNDDEDPSPIENPNSVEQNKRYNSKKAKDKKSIFLKTAHKRRMFYREHLLTNVFNSEFDEIKREKVKLEKFMKISNKE